MAIVQKTFCLIGPLKGQTMHSGRWHFIDGECKWQGTSQDEPLITSFLKRMWQVEVKDGWVSNSETKEEVSGRDGDADKATDEEAAISKTDGGSPRGEARSLPKSEDRSRSPDPLDVKAPKQKEAEKTATKKKVG